MVPEAIGPNSNSWGSRWPHTESRCPFTMKQNPRPWFQTATLENIPDGTELIFDRNGGREVTKRSIARVCRMLANILRGALRDEIGVRQMCRMCSSPVRSHAPTAPPPSGAMTSVQRPQIRIRRPRLQLPPTTSYPPSRPPLVTYAVLNPHLCSFSAAGIHTRLCCPTTSWLALF